MNWHEYFLNICQTVKTKSKDPSTKTGCVIVKNNIVISVGFNGFPIGVYDDEDRYLNRKIKLQYICHAEFNAICLAARNGISTQNATLYVPWQPCSNCTKAIIQGGISKIIIDGNSIEYNNLELRTRWQDDYDIANDMLRESNVPIYVFLRPDKLQQI